MKQVKFKLIWVRLGWFRCDKPCPSLHHLLGDRSVRTTISSNDERWNLCNRKSLFYNKFFGLCVAVTEWPASTVTGPWRDFPSVTDWQIWILSPGDKLLSFWVPLSAICPRFHFKGNYYFFVHRFLRLTTIFIAIRPLMTCLAIKAGIVKALT